MRGLPSSSLNQLGLIPLSPDPFYPFSTGPCFIGPLEFVLLSVRPVSFRTRTTLSSTHLVIIHLGLDQKVSYQFVLLTFRVSFFRTLLLSSFSKLPFATLSPTQIVLYRFGLKSFSPSTLRPVTTL